jgi:hypothetical protein
MWGAPVVGADVVPMTSPVASTIGSTLGRERIEGKSVQGACQDESP